MTLARLIPSEGGEAVELNRDVIIVGRKEDCDLHIDHKSISKQHCVLAVTDGLVFVRDLGSTNGTRVNGQRIRRAALVPNDEIAFAAKKYRFVVGPVEPPPEAKTQALDADEIAEFVKTADPPEPESPAPVVPKAEVQIQNLPDVYSKEGPKES